MFETPNLHAGVAAAAEGYTGVKSIGLEHKKSFRIFDIVELQSFKMMYAIQHSVAASPLFVLRRKPFQIN